MGWGTLPEMRLDDSAEPPRRQAFLSFCFCRLRMSDGIRFECELSVQGSCSSWGDTARSDRRSVSTHGTNRTERLIPFHTLGCAIS
jgi:hypothetical protein